MHHDKVGKPIEIDDYLVVAGPYSTLKIVQVKRFNEKTVVCVPIARTKTGKERKSLRVYPHESIHIDKADIALYKLYTSA